MWCEAFGDTVKENVGKRGHPSSKSLQIPQSSPGLATLAWAGGAENSFGEKRTLWLDAGSVAKDSEPRQDSGTVLGSLGPGLVLGTRHSTCTLLVAASGDVGVGNCLVCGSLRPLKNNLNFQGSLKQIWYPRGLCFIPFVIEN